MQDQPESAAGQPPDRSRGQAAGALNAFSYPTPRPTLAWLSLEGLASELLARLTHGQSFTRDKDLVLASQLLDVLQSQVDVHLNRFSRRRLYDVVRPVLDVVPPGALAGGTVVEFGSGSLNPLAFGFALLAMGARRAYSIDLEPVQDMSRAVRALAETATWLLLDPVSVVDHHALDSATVLKHLEGFDLGALANGDSGGIPPDRLTYRNESVYDLTIANGEASLVSSVSLLEHVDRIDDALASLRRVTGPGGIGHHIVDFIDHRIYGDETLSPFGFLTIATDEALVHGCNRIRCDQLCARFERHGFHVEIIEPIREDPLTPDEQRQFVEPYRSMDPAQLSITCARIVVRRVS